MTTSHGIWEKKPGDLCLLTTPLRMSPRNGRDFFGLRAARRVVFSVWN